MARELWVDKYRPKRIGDYVWRDKSQKNQVQSWIEEGVIPNLLLAGSPGTGKTSLAGVLMNELGIHNSDILKVNASHENKVDDMRTKITYFVQQIPFEGDFRYVLLDEADYLTPNAQAILRGLIEENSRNARFILTCNYVNKIMPAIKSRTQTFVLESLDREEFETKVALILSNEGIDFELETLDNYVLATFPDLRKCIQSLEQNSSNGVLCAPNQNDMSGTEDVFVEMISLFKHGKIRQARELIVGKLSPEQMESVFSFVYQNIGLFPDNVQEDAIVIIRDGLVSHSMVADPEINLSATMVQLAKLMEG